MFTLTVAQNSPAFACSQFPIPQSQQYVVLPGDILVVCVQTRVSSGGPGRLGISASVNAYADVMYQLINSFALFIILYN